MVASWVVNYVLNRTIVKLPVDGDLAPLHDISAVGVMVFVFYIGLYWFVSSADKAGICVKFMLCDAAASQWLSSLS